MLAEAQSLKEVFLAALALAPAERAAWLERACGQDADLRRHLDLMLAAHDAPQSLLDRLAPHVATAEAPAAGAVTAEDPLTERPGTVIGPYKLLEQIGEGGMGTVWMAQQTEPVKRLVAIKLIKAGMDSRQVLARFEAERQALALMDHPNIARVLDGGTTDAGRPYFVMDLVKGVPITKYCDEHHLTPRERLELFLPVCRAVQHAHQKGIIHRDLKPSNVLVALSDDKPLPKIIDFGVAKATGPKLTEQTMFTQFGQLIGTLEYMSPEQASLNAQDIDTRSDIYALGVLLYELLTGTTPFEKKRLRESPFDEVLRIIREEEPPKPSTRRSDTWTAARKAQGAGNGAFNRKGASRAALRALRFYELDWIVMRCLEKDRNRRYETVNALAGDLQRYLANEPVLAGPPSQWYRFRKFARRNRRVLAAASIMVLLLVSGVVAMSVSLIKIDQERREKLAALDAESKRRKQTREALDAMSSNVIADWLSKQDTLSPEQRQYLEQTLKNYEDFATDTGQSEDARAGVAAAYRRVGQIRFVLRQMTESAAAWERCRDLYANLVADFPNAVEYRRELAGSYYNLCRLYGHMHRDLAAERACAQSLTIREQLAAEDPANPDHQQALAASCASLAIWLDHTERAREAALAHARALNIRTNLVAESPSNVSYRRDLAESLHEAGKSYAHELRVQEAEELLVKALAVQSELVREYPAQAAYRYDLAYLQLDVSAFYRGTRRSGEAAEACAQAIAIQKRLAADYPAVAQYRRLLGLAHLDLARLYRKDGRVHDAQNEFVTATAILRQLLTDYPTDPSFQHTLAEAQQDHGVHLEESSRRQDAEAPFVEARALFKTLTETFPESRQFRRGYANAGNSLGILFKNTNRLPEAEAALDEAVTQRRQLVAELPTVRSQRRDLAGSLSNLGNVLRDIGRPQDAEKALREALEIQRQLVAEYPAGADYQNELAGSMVNLGRLLQTVNRFDEARRLFVEALPHHQSALGMYPNNPQYRAFYRINRRRLAETLVDLKDHAFAIDAAGQLLDAAGTLAADCYNAACVMAACVPLAEQDEGLDPAKRKELAKTYGDRAIAALRQAIDKGFTDAAQAKKEPKLDPLRSHENFQKLWSVLESKAQASPKK